MTYSNAQNNNSENLFRIKHILVDPNSNTLSLGERKKRVEPKTIHLLCFFAENARKVLTRDHLMSEVWPGVVVGNEALNRAVFSLRLALGDDAKNPIFIETIPKRGYRFLCLPKAEVKKESMVKKCMHFIPIRPIKIAASLLVFIFMCGFTARTFFFNKTPWQVGQVLPFSQTIGEELEPNIHGASNQLSYVYIYQWQPDVYVRNLNNSEAIRLSNDQWYPELDPTDERKYNNSIFGRVLSILEQKYIFSGNRINTDGFVRPITTQGIESYDRITTGISNQKPTVNIAAPTNGTTFGVNQEITITANALDSDGEVVRLNFFCNDTNLISSLRDGSIRQNVYMSTNTGNKQWTGETVGFRSAGN